MEEDNCTLLGWCNVPWHDHEEASEAPPLAALVDTQDPAFELIAGALTEMNEAGVKLTADSVQIAVKLGQHRHRNAAPTPAVPPETAQGLRHDVVYYMRFGNRIKIGTSGVLYTRVQGLKPDEVLAAEPGSYDLEAQRHREFAPYRDHGEYFFPAPALLAHINKVRNRYRRTRSPKAQQVNVTVANKDAHLF